MTTSLLQRWVNESPERSREYARESLIVDVSEEICAALERAGITKSELAQRLGTSKSHVTQLLSGARNLTLRSLADIAFVLGRHPCFKLSVADTSTSWKDEDDVIFRRPISTESIVSWDASNSATLILSLDRELDAA